MDGHHHPSSGFSCTAHGAHRDTRRAILARGPHCHWIPRATSFHRPPASWRGIYLVARTQGTHQQAADVAAPVDSRLTLVLGDRVRIVQRLEEEHTGSVPSHIVHEVVCGPVCRRPAARPLRPQRALQRHSGGCCCWPCCSCSGKGSRQQKQQQGRCPLSHASVPLGRHFTGPGA